MEAINVRRATLFGALPILMSAYAADVVGLALLCQDQSGIDVDPESVVRQLA